MKQVKRGIAILAVLIVELCAYSVPAFAQPVEEPEVLTSADGILLMETDSPEDVGVAAPAAQNDAFFEIDLNSGDVTTPDDRVVPDGFEMICGTDYASSGLEDSTGEDREEIIETLTDGTDFFALNEADENTAEVTAPYSSCRLMVSGGADAAENGIDTYGAVTGAVYQSDCILSYEDEAATVQAYENLCQDFGSDQVLIDLPVCMQEDASDWADSCMGYSQVKGAISDVGADVTVAVLDSGIYKYHKAFSGRNIGGGYDFVNGDNNPADDQGHGTAVSSVIARSTGTNVGIMPLKVLDRNGKGSSLNFLLAVRYAKQNGADLINISAGMSIVDALGANKNRAQEYVKSMDAILKEFKGPIVVAAGNNSENIESKVFWPAISDQVIAVSALKKTGSAFVFDNSYSNYGSSVDFGAPGTGIRLAKTGTSNNYYDGKGTSFAAPFATGAAALMMANNTSIVTRSQVMKALRSISIDLEIPGKDTYTGYGCPNLGGMTVSSSKVRRSIGQASVSGLGAKTYTGSAIKPALKLYRGIFTLKEGEQYRIVSYSSNRNVGTAKVVIRGLDKYSSTVTKTFKIIPKGTTLTSVKKAKKAVEVRWKKQTQKMSASRITGYQIQVALDSGFTKGIKTVTAKGYKRTYLKVSGLKAHKRYYVRVRTYKTVSGKNYCSNWSKIKSITTK